MKKFHFLLPLALLIFNAAQGQQDPQFTHYMFNTLYYNPAYAGAEGVTKFTAIHRSQWAGYVPTFGDGGAPTSQVISMSSPLNKMRSGVGAYIVNDRLGALNNLEAQASFAYNLALKDTKLSFGLKAGMYSQTLNFDLYRYIDPNDPLLKDQAGKTSQVRPDLAAGVFMQREKFYAGVSFNHLIKSTFDFGVSQRSSLEPHMYVTGGYYYQVNFDLRLQFSTLIKSDFTKTTFDVGGLAYYKEKMWGGLSFRQSEAAIVMLGYSLLKERALKVGYGMDVIVKDREAKQPLSHEILLTYELPVNPNIGKKIVRTPRYRH
ncbi:MAG: type IX secretion system membrane protein PorP/SprF [Cyclobacteriaceae bacterium]|nr:type IX secretion system membrane protein PorP/SprF [Cyclobacteriaceae bacterium]